MQHAAPMLTQIFHVFFSYNVKIKITHNIVPINLQSSVNVTGKSRLNICPNLLSRSTYF